MSARDARRLALGAQGLSGPKMTGGPGAMLRKLRAVQLDTISVLARSHELVSFSRLGPIGRPRIELDYWGPKSATFEYWSHAACILPIEDWPAYGFKRRAAIARGRRWHRLEDVDKSCSYVRDRLRAEGPLSAARARRRQERWPLVGLERDQDRGGMALGHRRARLSSTQGLPACLRPGRARHPCQSCSASSSTTRPARCALSRRPARPSGWRRRATSPPITGSHRRQVEASVRKTAPGAGQRRRMGRARRMSPRRHSACSSGGCGAGPCSCHPSTRSPGTGRGPSGSSAFRHRLEAYVPRAKRRARVLLDAGARRGPPRRPRRPGPVRQDARRQARLT